MTNDYYRVFQERCRHRGRTFKEVVQNQAILDFKRFLISSPNAIDVCINDRDSEPIRVATILSKEKNDTIVRRFFLAEKEQELKIGDFIYWDDTIWILMKKEKDTIEAYDKFEGLECRHTIKWIDNYGILRELPCYLVAQTDEKIKNNFRTWNDSITPLPNKYLGVITSRANIQIAKRFILDETAWSVTETDYISVKGIIYLAMTEDKLDNYQDDIPNDIADVYELNKFTLTIPDSTIDLGIGNEYNLTGQIYLNGNAYSSDIVVEILEGEEYISIDSDLKITGIAEGTVKLRISMEENNEINQEMEINVVTGAASVVSYELLGDTSIKWGRTKIYQMVEITDGVQVPTNAIFTIEDNNKLLKNYQINNNSITITAGSDDIGEITIKAEVSGTTYEKIVNVVSLWM